MSKIAKDAFIEQVKDTYKRGDETMYELLGYIKPSMNMTLDECFQAYEELMEWCNVR